MYSEPQAYCFSCLWLLNKLSRMWLKIATEIYSFTVQFRYSIVSNSLQPHGLQYAGLPCPSPSSGVCSNSCPLSQGCHPTISSSVIPFSFCLQFFLASESFLPVSQLLLSGAQSIEASASVTVLSMNIQDWFPLVLIGLISLQCKGLLSLLQNHSSLWSNFHICTWLLEKL